MKLKYHGWILRNRKEGYNDTFHVEYDDGDVRRVVSMGYSAGQAVEFSERRVGRPVKLMDTPLGAYRVYTEEEEK